MCGHYYSRFEKQQIAERFHVRRGLDDVGPIVPNYNVAPETFQPVIRRSRENPRERELVMMRWRGSGISFGRQMDYGVHAIRSRSDFGQEMLELVPSRTLQGFLGPRFDWN